MRYPGCALDRSNLAEVYFLQSFIIKICVIDVCALDLFIVAALSLISLVARLGKTGQGKPGRATTQHIKQRLECEDGGKK